MMWEGGRLGALPSTMACHYKNYQLWDLVYHIFANVKRAMRLVFDNIVLTVSCNTHDFSAILLYFYSFRIKKQWLVINWYLTISLTWNFDTHRFNAKILTSLAYHFKHTMHDWALTGRRFRMEFCIPPLTFFTYCR